MSRTFEEALHGRRSCYAIDDRCPLTGAQAQEIMDFALQNVPSAFNSQTTRMVLLLGEHHKKLWHIVTETLRKIVPAEAFGNTESKIESFAAGYGTILYYEDMSIVRALQDKFKTYAENFPTWAEHTNAMHQLVVWTMLEDGGCGASLQHYNPIIDLEVASTWSISADWKLIAQMPFGGLVERPDAPGKISPEERRRVFK